MKKHISLHISLFGKMLFASSILASLWLLSACQSKEKVQKAPNLVVTTTHMTELIAALADSGINIQGLMGPGVDPHLYKASEGDLAKLAGAHSVAYHGMHLEGKMIEVFESIHKQGKPSISAEKCLINETLLSSEDYPGTSDPHVWFDLELWAKTTECVAAWLKATYPSLANRIEKNKLSYITKIDELKAQAKAKMDSIPEQQKVLITAHDAFQYFGKQYGLEVKGLLGLSTADEASTKDIQDLAQFIVSKKIPAIFIESSVPTRYLDALTEAVQAKGFNVKIGGELFSDALGTAGTAEGTFHGMYQHNVNTIASNLSLKQ